ncbi:MAG: DUF1192 domain-containing protein [Nitratireductor sp.]
MFIDNDEPKKTAPFTLGQNLDDMSVEELGEVILQLEEEMVRLQSAKENKSKHLNEAQALFSKP